MGPVDGVPRPLKPATRRPAAGGEEGAGRGGIAGEVGERDRRGAIEDPDLAAEVHLARRAEVGDAGVGRVGGAVDLAGLEILVGRPAVAQLQHGDEAPVRGLERHLRAHGEPGGRLGRGSQRDGDGPDGAALQPALADHAQVVPRVHEALERGVPRRCRGAPGRSPLGRRAGPGAARRRGRGADRRPHRGPSGRRARLRHGRDEAGRRASCRPACRVEEAELLQPGEDRGQALGRPLAVGVDHDLGRERGLVGVVDAGEALDLAGEGPGVQALHVPLLEDTDRAVAVHLAEAPDGTPLLVPDRSVGADGGRDGAGAGAREELGDEADAADVGVPVLAGEAEALREVGAHLVAVEQTTTWIPRRGSSAASKAARSHDFPDPDSPVNHTTKPSRRCHRGLLPAPRCIPCAGRVSGR